MCHSRECGNPFAGECVDARLRGHDKDVLEEFVQVCSTEYVYYALLNTGDEIIKSIVANGLRSLSDFPESERWQQINTQLPGFFENLYEMVARPVLQRPYMNAGEFVSPLISVCCRIRLCTTKRELRFQYRALIQRMPA